jgi:hypothetical protein
MWIGTTKFYQAASSVQQAVDSALTNEVDRSGVVPGRVAWDDCPCGLLAVSIGRVYLSDEFPFEKDTVTGNCQAAWEVAELIVQVIRCAPQPQDGQLSPTVEALDEAAQIMAADAAETLNALAKWICSHVQKDIIDGLVLTIEPQGPEGDCVGSEFRLRVAFPRG